MQSHKRKYPIAHFMHQQKQQQQSSALRRKMTTPPPPASDVSVIPPSPPSPPKRKTKMDRKCRFRNVVFVKEIPSHRTYSHSERFNCWYDEEDFRCFKLAIFLDRINEMRQTKIIDGFPPKMPCRKPSLEDFTDATSQSLYRSPPPRFAKKSIKNVTFSQSQTINLVDDSDNEDDVQVLGVVKSNKPFKKRFAPQRDTTMMGTFKDTLYKIQLERERLIKTIDTQQRPAVPALQQQQRQQQQQQRKAKKIIRRGRRPQSKSFPNDRRQGIPDFRDENMVRKYNENVLGTFSSTGIMPSKHRTISKQQIQRHSHSRLRPLAA